MKAISILFLFSYISILNQLSHIHKKEKQSKSKYTQLEDSEIINKNSIFTSHTGLAKNNIYDIDIKFEEKIKQIEETLYSKLKNPKSNIKTLNNRKEDVESKAFPANSTSIDNSPNSAYYKIISLSTDIVINNDKTHGEVIEKTKFELNKGLFTSIIRKFSLAGSSNTLIAFKLTSNDVKLKEARIISNCLESGEVDPTNNKMGEYVCVIGIFEEINAREQAKVIEIEYKYIAHNLLRLNQHNQDGFNTIVWVYDNFKRNKSVENINLNLYFRNNEEVANIKKENFKIDQNNFNHTVNSNLKETVISWDVSKIKENEIKKIMIDVPLFNRNSRALYDYDIENTSYSITQYSLWMLTFIIFCYMTVFIYINERDKYDSLKLCEEESFLKAFQEKEEELSKKQTINQQ